MMSFPCDGTMSINVYKYLKWARLNCRPLSICEDPEFIDMQMTLSRNYKPLDRHFVTDKVIVICVVVKQILIIMLRGQDVAITCDHWSSVTNMIFGHTAIQPTLRQNGHPAIRGHTVGRIAGWRIAVMLAGWPYGRKAG
jgi:hypothetical protein